MIATTACAACGAALVPGAAVVVTDLATGRARHVHRPEAQPGCFHTVGPANVEAIRLLDPEAAAAFDRADGTWQGRFRPRADTWAVAQDR